MGECLVDPLRLKRGVRPMKFQFRFGCAIVFGIVGAITSSQASRALPVGVASAAPVSNSKCRLGVRPRLACEPLGALRAELLGWRLRVSCRSRMVWPRLASWLGWRTRRVIVSGKIMEAGVEVGAGIVSGMIDARWLDDRRLGSLRSEKSGMCSCKQSMRNHGSPKRERDIL